jgi:rare lipoprotein A
MKANCRIALASCASAPPPPRHANDGPEARPPPDLMAVPDALPQLEPIRDGGPNKAYAVFGESYTPLRAEAVYSEQGLASWYGRAFHGRPTASGEIYNMYAMTAAHKTLPIPSYARVVNPANGRSAIVRINDRGPFVKGRIIDLSYTAALKLDTLRGVVPVVVERITPAQIASGAWQRGALKIDGDDPPPAPGAPLPPERAYTVDQRGFWVQLGAYRERGGAQHMQQQAADRLPEVALLLAVFSDKAWHRVQAGPFTGREQAQALAERVREALSLSAIVVERR